MRPIKFRAWHKKEKKMYYITFPDDIQAEARGEIPIGEKQADGHGDTSVDLHDKELVFLQYAGLKDKRGKEIYEGDILATGHTPSGKPVNFYYIKSCLPFIRFENGEGWEYENGDYYLGGDIQCHPWNEFEVIGNIYENKDLLK